MKDHMLVIVMQEEAEKPENNEDGKVMVPLYNIPMMSDERWNELAGRKRMEAKV